MHGTFPTPATPSTDERRPTPKPRKTNVDLSLKLAIGALWCVVLPVGALIISINGGYSVVGLHVVANAFNDPGQFMWAAVSAVSFRVPVPVPGLPTTQPVIPWCIVLATDVLQIVVLWRKLTGRHVPIVFIAAAILFSGYDLATTGFGLHAVSWIMHAGYVVLGIIAVLITFGVEATISLLLRKV